MKTNKNFKQKGQKIGSAGGFFNQLMSHNSSIPVVGKGATMLYYSDRDAYEVLEVNEAKKSCVIQKYNAKRVDEQGMSEDQVYEYEKLDGPKITLVYRWGGWKRVGSEVRFIEEFANKFSGFNRKLHDAYKAKGGEYSGAFISTEIDGMTKRHITYNKVNIIFGVKREYYDYSF